MFGGIRVALTFLSLVIAGSAEAQGDLDRGKTAAQLYASACTTCHKSPPSISRTRWLFGLESFLREHYTSSSESAAILAAYLKGQEKLSNVSQPNRGPRSIKQVSNSTVNEFGEEIPRPPAEIPGVKH